MAPGFPEALSHAVTRIRGCAVRDILLFHHNDTDGLSSAAILNTAFEREGYVVKSFALEKPYPEVLDRVFSDNDGRSNEGRIIIFADFAGKIAPLLARYNRKRNLVVILDHHPAEPSTDDTVLNLDPDLFGLKGDLDISGSTTCYRFALALNPENEDLAPLAVLGAVGDGFFLHGRLVSENRAALDRSVELGTGRVEVVHGREIYHVRLNGSEYPCEELTDYLDTLGAVGYYQGGADAGLRLCRTGVDREMMDQYRFCREIREDRFDRMRTKLGSGELRTIGDIQWFDSGSLFAPMGVKMIGVFCNEIRNSSLVDRSRYLAGFQHIPNEIPGFGEIDFGKTKISMRVSDEIAAQIRGGTLPGLSSFLPEATLRLGGFADACHGLSAATTVRIGEEESLIRGANQVLHEVMQ